MVVRNILQAQAEFSALMGMVQQGDGVILSKSGSPVARILPYRRA
jgi:prevent-host-death family protein